MTEEFQPRGNGGQVATEATPAAPAESSPAMTTDAEQPQKPTWRRRMTLISGGAALIAAIVVIPPMINIGRYQHQVTALMSQSLGRPVSLSSVELRLLPRPGFVLHDLTVGEDPAFGAEPVLSARTVVASVRMFSLWRGRTEISRISVDEASLNLVRSEKGRWNLESLMLGAQPVLTTGPGGSETRPVASGKPGSFPYLEATNSRVNLKKGVEKGPFSLVAADLSLWQDEPGQWRVRLNGQPFRTDMEMSLADTGEVRVEGSLKTASQLRDMPLKLQVSWRDAQLGELSRLILGSDAGWRGDLAADVDVQGTLDNAQTKTRLRASGVRREEFAPESPLDFDANCSFRLQHSQNAVHDVDCNTAIGDGQLHLKGEIPDNGGQPEGMLEVKQVSLQAGLDLLRTVRGSFAPGINARGTLNGELAYKVASPAPREASGPEKKTAASHRSGSGKSKGDIETAAVPSLQGTLTMDGASLRGGALKEPLTLPKTVWAPTQGLISLRSAASQSGRPEGHADRRSGNHASAAGSQAVELGTRFNLPISAAAPPAASAATPAQAQTITVRVALGLEGYKVALGGSASAVKIRDLVYGFGSPHLDAAESLTGGVAELDLTAVGPWIVSTEETAASPETPSETESKSPTQDAATATRPAMLPEVAPKADTLAGTVQLHHMVWKPAYLASAVEMPQGLVTVSETGFSMSSDFSFGTSKDTVKGVAQLTASPTCKGTDCRPQVSLRFAVLDAGVLQAALLGAPAQKSLLSPLIDRVRSQDRPKWPAVTLSVQAESLVLGPVTLHKPSARLKMEERDVTLEHWDAGLLGGTASGTGHFTWSADSPKYAVEGTFTGVNAAQLAELVQSPWSGGPVNGSGSVQLSGLTYKDLAASATGEVKFNWQHGALTLGEHGVEAVSDSKSDVVDAKVKERAVEPIRFDNWTGLLAIKSGKAQLEENALIQGKRTTAVTGAIPFGGPAQLSLGHPADGRADHAAAKAGK